MRNDNDLTNKKMNEILSKFNFVFSLKYKDELECSISPLEALFSNEQIESNDDIEYIKNSSQTKKNLVRSDYVNELFLKKYITNLIPNDCICLFVKSFKI